MMKVLQDHDGANTASTLMIKMVETGLPVEMIEAAAKWTSKIMLDIMLSSANEAIVHVQMQNFMAWTMRRLLVCNTLRLEEKIHLNKQIKDCSKQRKSATPLSLQSSKAQATVVSLVS